MSQEKPSDKLTPSDLEKNPVWTFNLANEGVPGRDGTWMVPVKTLPVTDLRNCGCRARAHLASGREILVVLWNVAIKRDPAEEKLRKIFEQMKSQGHSFMESLQYSIWVKDQWWIAGPRGHFISPGRPQAHTVDELATALEASVDDIFPISYDISAFAVGPAEVIKGTIPRPQ